MLRTTYPHVLPIDYCIPDNILPYCIPIYTATYCIPIHILQPTAYLSKHCNQLHTYLHTNIPHTIYIPQPTAYLSTYCLAKCAPGSITRREISTIALSSAPALSLSNVGTSPGTTPAAKRLV